MKGFADLSHFFVQKFSGKQMLIFKRRLAGISVILPEITENQISIKLHFFPSVRLYKSSLSVNTRKKTTLKIIRLQLGQKMVQVMFFFDVYNHSKKTQKIQFKYLCGHYCKFYIICIFLVHRGGMKPN